MHEPEGRAYTYRQPVADDALSLLDLPWVTALRLRACVWRDLQGVLCVVYALLARLAAI